MHYLLTSLLNKKRKLTDHKKIFAKYFFRIWMSIY